ncbi:hypothetical protein [Streptomyces scopuliridis]|uniref:hypothetical protein n=1 Tax=Streptomyces scopuliridis TaxID=452529 RepID=UPI0036A08D5C
MAWWDLTEWRTMRAEPVSPEAMLQAAVNEKRVAQMMKRAPEPPEPYDWREFADNIFDWQEAHPSPPWAAEQWLALVGVERHLHLMSLALIDARLRRLARESHVAGAGPSRLSVLSGVSRRTVPGWLEPAPA